VTLRGISAPQQIGRYEIHEELGRGAMGVVFKARDPFIGRLVAVKTITTGIADNPDLLERFRREAQAAGGLQHPNIVTIYEMSEFDGTPFIAMEYLEGTSLENTIERKLRLPLALKLGYMVQACRALDYAHRRGVIHRDVKPANIMVTSEGVVKVVDFGIARIVDTAKTQTGALLGTLSYMSPEQVRGRQADQRCDVWALGVVMYELLTYRRPFEGENHAALLMCILEQEPRSIREFLPECPPALENVVQRMLRKDEALRYPTMEALLADLEPIWTSLQKEAVQKQVSHGRELIKNGKLEEASEVLRKALSIDAGNLSAKTLFDQVSESLGPDFRPAVKNERITGDQDRILTAVSRADKQGSENRQGGTMALTPQFDPLPTWVMEPDRKQSDSANPPVQNRGRREGGTMIAPTPMKASRNDRPAPPAPGQRSTAPKAAPPMSATPQSPALSAHRDVALQKDGATRNRAPIFSAAGVIVLLIIGAAGYWKMHPGHKVADEPQVNLQPPAPSEAQPVAPAAASNAHPPTEAPAAPTASIEEQQRHLIDQAHQAADAKDFKTARIRLDEAAKLDGPLNALITYQRRELSDEAHSAEMRQVAQQEQALWARAMTDVDAGRFDESEQSLREILTLPESGPHWTDAAKYVDEVIPERRKEEQLWARAQQESGLTGHEHRINEVKILDQVLASGGVHQQGARQRRDSLFSQFTRESLRRNNSQDSVVSASEQAQFPRLEDAVDQAVTQGDAKALQQLQEFRPRFKSFVDGGGPFLLDARDYLNNILPKAQNVIEAKLANAEADTLSNAKFRDAVKQFGQAVATQNIRMLRSEIQPEFQVIANTGGPRTKEAERYLEVLIPAALKKSSVRVGGE
jgi:serine/threonine protein kinase/tetratricopeptide (TPR) repeat protein